MVRISGVAIETSEWQRHRKPQSSRQTHTHTHMCVLRSVSVLIVSRISVLLLSVTCSFLAYSGLRKYSTPKVITIFMIHTNKMIYT